MFLTFFIWFGIHIQPFYFIKFSFSNVIADCCVQKSENYLDLGIVRMRHDCHKSHYESPLLSIPNIIDAAFFAPSVFTG